MKIRTICRCDEDGKPAGEHSSDCPYRSWAYQEAVDRLRERQEQQRARETGNP